MTIKKSTLLLIPLCAGSVSLLVFSSAVTPPAATIPPVPVECAPEKSCSQITEPKTICTWDMFSQIMWRSEA